MGELLRLPASTVYHLAKKGELPAFRVGRSWRFPLREIERLTQGTRALLRILVVDDDQVTQTLVGDVLESRSCRVWTATTVDEALGLVRAHRFDLLFIDLKLPGRDGIELIRALPREYPPERLVIITAFPEAVQAAGLPVPGAVKVLQKPLAVLPLVHCVEQALSVRLPEAGADAGSTRSWPGGS